MKLYFYTNGFYCLGSNGSIYSFEKRKCYKMHADTLDEIAFNAFELNARCLADTCYSASPTAKFSENQYTALFVPCMAP